MRHLLFLISLTLASAQCPWENSLLKNWNDPTAWTNGVPTPASDVVISGTQKIRINTNITVSSITVRQGGLLVWGNFDGLEIVANYVLIGDAGRFDVGSETCRFTKRATITLLGRADEPDRVPNFGTKFLGVSDGGTLEMHGRVVSPAWTQLAQTVESKGYTKSDGGRGLTAVVMDENSGQVLVARSFDTYGSTNESEALASLINSLPNGRVVAVGARDSANGLTESLYRALESLGATKARTGVCFRCGYALVGVKGGSNASAVEVANGRNFSSLATKDLGPQNSVWTVSVSSAGWEAGNFLVISIVGPTNPIITLTTPVTWAAGDRVVLASTDFSMYQAEEFALQSCPECQPNQVKLNGVLRYTHFGEIVDGVDERGEVALLTRNILIQGKMESACYSPQNCTLFPYDTFGAHFKVVRGFVNVHVEGVEFYRMGQQILGRYPIHFHMASDVDEVGGYMNRTYVKDNSIHHSFARCVTIHGTHGLLVKNNVGYDHLGHCFFLEDGIETRNVFDGNLGLLTKPGGLLPSDRDTNLCLAITPRDFNGMPTSPGECNGITTFWITNPNNDLINNVAAGSYTTGIWYIFPYHPTGESTTPSIFPTQTPIGRFYNNRAHSNGLNGLFFDEGIKITQPNAQDPEQYLAMWSMRYNPRQNPNDRASPRVPAVLENLTCYKNRNRGVWVRGGDFRFIDYKSADNAIGMTLASEGTTPNDPGSSQTLENGIFVGESKNIGTRDSYVVYSANLGRNVPKDERFPVRGFEFYDGPVSITNVTFSKFFPTAQRNASAIGWLLGNNWQNSPYNNASKCSFDNSLRVFLDGDNTTPKPYFSDLDGDLNAIFKDIDGTVTGVRGGSIVNLVPYFQTYRCSPRPEWAAQVCHDKYAQVYIQNLNAAATNYSGNAPGIFLVRDEKTSYRHSMMGIPSGDPRYQFQPIVILGKTYTLHFKHASPPTLRFNMINFNPNETLRIGICYPPNTTFDVKYTVNGGGAITLTAASSIQQVDASTGNVYFWDAEARLLFIKLSAKLSRVGDYYYPMAGMEAITVTASGPNMGKNSGDCTSTAYPKYQVQEYVPPNPGCIGDLDECGVCNGSNACLGTSASPSQTRPSTQANPSSQANPSATTPNPSSEDMISGVNTLLVAPLLMSLAALCH